MIGSHDTFTYLKTSNILAKLFTMFWRCQEASIEEQYKCGVRFFDVRVIHEKKKKIERWRIGHGIAKVNKTFNTLTEICDYFKNQFPGSKVRIVLESGCSNKYILERFRREVDELTKDLLDVVFQIIIKTPWTIIYQNGSFELWVGYNCELFNWDLDKTIIENIKQFDTSSWSIKKWAKKHNPVEITQEMIDDPDVLYFMDYVCVYPKL